MSGDVTPEREVLEWERLAHTLASVLDEHVGWQMHRGVMATALADAILASDWLAAHDAEVAARALREAADAWATGEWNDYFLADDVTDDESAVRSMDRFLRERAEAYRAGTGEGAGK